MTEAVGARGADNRPAEQPSVLETEKGFSVLYRERFLYSRHDPSRNPVNAVNESNIKPETVVICVSPVLGYGLEILLDKIPSDCCVLALECDEQLMAFSVAHIPERILKHPRFRYIRTASPSRVVEYIDSLECQPFKRCVRLNLSGGAAFNEQFYGDTIMMVDEYIQQYWRNHITLMRLGRNYARNFFRNLPLLARSLDEYGEANLSAPWKSLCEKNILVAGAGPSLDEAMPFIKNHRESLFILAVDTALKPLADSGIAADAIVVVESQFWIERAFTGFRNLSIPIFADLTARPNAIESTGGTRLFFLSEYARLKFLGRFIKSCPNIPVIPPLGSVGLVALYLARRISQAANPVFAVGLDFSWGFGLSHSRGAPSAIDVRRNATRFAPAGCQVPSLGQGVFSSTDAQGNTVFTDPALSGYARLSHATFGGKNLPAMYNLGATGLDMGLERISLENAHTLVLQKKIGDEYDEAMQNEKKINQSARSQGIMDFLRSEKERLERVRGVLTGETAMENAAEFLEHEIREMDYLFAHFPDGYKGYVADPAFLKRVRIELEYFLKTVRTALE